MTNAHRIPADVVALVGTYGMAERNYARASWREMREEHRDDARTALLDRIGELIAAAPREEWQPIETLAESEELILACRASDGARMIWRASIHGKRSSLRDTAHLREERIELPGLGGWSLLPPLEGITSHWYLCDPDGGACAPFEDDEDAKAFAATIHTEAAQSPPPQAISNQRLVQFLDFVVKWTHRDNVTDSDRVGAIKCHPVVQARATGAQAAQSPPAGIR